MSGLPLGASQVLLSLAFFAEPHRSCPFSWEVGPSPRTHGDTVSQPLSLSSQEGAEGGLTLIPPGQAGTGGRDKFRWLPAERCVLPTPQSPGRFPGDIIGAASRPGGGALMVHPHPHRHLEPQREITLSDWTEYSVRN